MQMRNRDTVTVSPPTFDRTAFARTDGALSAPHAPFDRDWLMARFDEGLEIRMLKPPYEGLVMFQPGRLAWRPIIGAEQAVVIHDLRVGTGPLARDSAARLWAVAGNFAKYFGYAAVLALLGEGPGLVSSTVAPGRGWARFDTGPDGVRLVGQVLQGPMALPSLPSDWARRAAALGKGLVIQTTGESRRLEAQARDTITALAARGIPVLHDRLHDPEDLRARAVSPGAAYAVTCGGRVIGGAELGPEDLLRAVLCQSPS
jgi:hypothetical protein